MRLTHIHPAGWQMQKAALEAEMQRLRRQEAAHFTTFSRITAEKLEYMQKLSVVEGEAYMARVMLRTVRCQPGRLRKAQRPVTLRIFLPYLLHASFQAHSEVTALQNASTGAWDAADRSPPVCSARPSRGPGFNAPG
jgi:hypothetical protein